MPQGEQEALTAELMRKQGITRAGLRGSHRRRGFRGRSHRATRPSRRPRRRPRPSVPRPFRFSPRDFRFPIPQRLADRDSRDDPAILVCFFVTEKATTSFRESVRP